VMRRFSLLVFFTLGGLVSPFFNLCTELSADDLDVAAEAAVRHFMEKSFSTDYQSAPWEVVCLRRAPDLGTETTEKFLNRFDDFPAPVVDGRDCRAGLDGFWRWDDEVAGPAGLEIHLLELAVESANAVTVGIQISGGTHDFSKRECTFTRPNTSAGWRLRDCGVEVTT